MALVVITGGTRSGKSAAAQNAALSRATDGGSVVLAAFGRSSDPEMDARIARHRSERPDAFVTIEIADPSTPWVAEVPAESLLVVDCLGTALGLLMEQAWAESASGAALADADADALPEGLAESVEASFGRLVTALANRNGDTLIVTNEVGNSLVPIWASGRLFSDLLGRGNRLLITAADTAYLCVSGRLLGLTELPRTLIWPHD